MPPLRANVRPIDKARMGRLLIAWPAGDRVAAEVVLDEAIDDPLGTAGLVFSLADYAAGLTVAIAPDTYADQLRRAVLENVRADEPPVKPPTTD